MATREWLNRDAAQAVRCEERLRELFAGSSSLIVVMVLLPVVAGLCLDVILLYVNRAFFSGGLGRRQRRRMGRQMIHKPGPRPSSKDVYSEGVRATEFHLGPFAIGFKSSLFWRM